MNKRYDGDMNKVVLMCVDAKLFTDLTDLYPKAKAMIIDRSLERQK